MLVCHTNIIAVKSMLIKFINISFSSHSNLSYSVNVNATETLRQK